MTGRDDGAAGVWTEQTQERARAPMGPHLSRTKLLTVKERLGCLAVAPPRGHLEAGEVHDGFDEDGVVADVRVFAVQLRERAEERTAAGDVHLAHGSLEGGGSDIRAKGVDDVLPVALVQQHQGHLQKPQQRF